MGGTVNVFVRTSGPDDLVAAEGSARRVGARIDAWARRLTRFDDASDLSRLNASAAGPLRVRPTLAAALTWARDAGQRTGGLVDVTMLDARLAAEAGCDAPPPESRTWQIVPGGRSATVERSAPFALDLDGVAKGWLADRALELLREWPGAVVDADGDIAVSAGPGVEWLVDIADPFASGLDQALATVRLEGGRAWTQRYGVATSGTSIHSWTADGGRTTHHLIDPVTRRSADTDVIQATVVAPTAREAEMLAKTAVILGSRRALRQLDGSAALTAVMVLDSARVVALPGVERWLA